MNFTESQLALLDSTAAERRVNRSELIREAAIQVCEWDPSDMSWCRLCRGAHSPSDLIRYTRDNSGPDLPPVCVGCIESLSSEKENANAWR